MGSKFNLFIEFLDREERVIETHNLDDLDMSKHSILDTAVWYRVYGRIGESDLETD